MLRFSPALLALLCACAPQAVGPVEPVDERTRILVVSSNTDDGELVRGSLARNDDLLVEQETIDPDAAGFGDSFVDYDAVVLATIGTHQGGLPAMGNALATFVEDGGALVFWSESADEMPTGRFTAGGFSPVNSAFEYVGRNPFRCFFDQVVDDPMFAGVTTFESVCPIYGVEDGVETLATWDDSTIPVAAQRDAVVALGWYLAANDDRLGGDWATLLDNALQSALQAR